MAGKKNNPSGQSPRDRNEDSHNYREDPGIIKGGRAFGDYRFSATNMMLGLDPMILKARMQREMADKAWKDAQKTEAATQTIQDSYEVTEMGAARGVKEHPDTKQQGQPDAASEAPAESQHQSDPSAPESSSADDSGRSSGEERFADSSKISSDAAAATTESDAANASTDDDDAASGATSEAEASAKSVSFAEGTSAPADSPPASTDGRPPMLCVDVGINSWTMSEDAMILGMKEQGASWDLIASSIQRTKPQVRKRYYELKCSHANAAADAEDVGSVVAPNASVVMEPRSAAAMLPNIAHSIGAIYACHDIPVGIDNDECEDEGYEDDGYDEDEYEDEEEDESEDEGSSSSSLQASSSEADDDQASSTDDLVDLLHEDSSSASSSLTDEADGYDASDYDPFADPADPIAYERERRRQERFVRHHAHASMYIGVFPMAKSQVDAGFVSQGFSRRDRTLLAGLADRRVAAQWLEMQANFFNVTGRMIPLHLIKAKLENRSPSDAEIGCLARGEGKVAHWTEAVADTRDLLDPALARDAPEDALCCGTDDEGCGGTRSVSDDE